jgi:hypothetical protein
MDKAIPKYLNYREAHCCKNCALASYSRYDDTWDCTCIYVLRLHSLYMVCSKWTKKEEEPHVH